MNRASHAIQYDVLVIALLVDRPFKHISMFVIMLLVFEKRFQCI